MIPRHFHPSDPVNNHPDRPFYREAGPMHYIYKDDPFNGSEAWKLSSFDDTELQDIRSWIPYHTTDSYRELLGQFASCTPDKARALECLQW